MSTAVITHGGGYSPVPNVSLFFWPKPVDGCAVSGALAILAPGDPATNLPYAVLSPAQPTDPRSSNHCGLEIRFADGVRDFTLEVPRSDELYRAVAWDSAVQNVVTSSQDSARLGGDDLIAFRFTSEVPFYDVFLERVTDGQPLFIRSIRYTQ